MCSIESSHIKFTRIRSNYIDLTIYGGELAFDFNTYGVKGLGQQWTNETFEIFDKLQFRATSEGYIKWANGNSSYVYQYKDHLGNVRVSYEGSTINGTTTPVIIEEDNYYPFGLRHSGYNTTDAASRNIAAQKYKYNGKELQDELGLNFYDYGVRNYDPPLGRWMNIDPLAEKFVNISPYNYCLNSPLIFVDPNGKEVVAAGLDAQNLKCFN